MSRTQPASTVPFRLEYRNAIKNSEKDVTIHPIRLHVLPLAVACIVLATAIPIELRPAMPWDWRFDTLDFLQNLLLYVPLGWGLHRQSWWTVVAVALALSVSAEVLQMFSFMRFCSPYDVLCNGIGACIGAWTCRRIAPYGRAATFIVSGMGLAAALVLSIAVLAIWRLPVARPQPADWNPNFPILLGNETTNDRPWKGTVSEVAILRGALTRGEIASAAQRSSSLDAMFQQRMLYRHQSSNVLSGGPGIRLPASLSEDLARSISADGAFTVILRISVENVLQEGPARIISFSANTLNRNFDLGQERERLVLRVRTPVSGKNGADYRAETPPLLKAQTDTSVIAAYDGAVSRIFVDGSLHARSNLAAAGCLIYAVCDSASPLAWSVLGGCAALLAFVFIGTGSYWQMLIAAVLAGGAVLVLLPWAHVLPPWPLMPKWTSYMTLVGATAVVIAAYQARPSGTD